MNSDDTQYVEAIETINTSSSRVWSVLTNTRSWPKWWSGHTLVKAVPTWQKNAELVWNKGREAIIYEFEPQKLLDFGGVNMGMEMHHSFKLIEDSNSTKVVYRFSVKGADFGHKEEEVEKIKNTLSKLKKVCEHSNVRKWWQFWA